MPSWGLLKYIATKLQTTSFYLILGFLENKKGLELVSPASFSAYSLMKDISFVIFH